MANGYSHQIYDLDSIADIALCPPVRNLISVISSLLLLSISSRSLSSEHKHKANHIVIVCD
jgi:hypothetical protein